MTTWFNKKNGKAIAEMAEILRVESQVRAKAEERLRVEIATRASIEPGRTEAPHTAPQV